MRTQKTANAIPSQKKATSLQNITSTNWPTFYPPYSTPEGWEVEKLSALHDVLDTLYKARFEHAKQLFGAESLTILDKASDLLKKKHQTSNKIFDICWKYNNHSNNGQVQLSR